MATILVICFYLYLLLGLLFGLWFVFKGVHQMDEGMRGAKTGLRLLLLPGTMALWPVMLRKFLKSKKISST